MLRRWYVTRCMKPAIDKDPSQNSEPCDLISAEQIQKRVREIARQISDDYQGSTIHALALLENGFMFMSDLVRALEVPVICQFIKPRYRREENGPEGFLEIFFSHDADIRDQHIFWWRA